MEMAPILDKITASGEEYWRWIQQNPKQTAAYATAGIAVAAPMAIAAPILGVFGFGASGIAAGSVAAGAQTANVAAGSLFAILQSAGMGGYGVAAVGGAVQAGGFVGGIITALKKACDRQSLNPIESIWDERHGIVEATNRFWDSFPTEKLTTMMNMTPQIVERLKKMKDSMLGY
ncbi:hypothetical protein F5Y00DRAFT_61303 [Daldinia vernicosa]|uniref:uncharacterized protein n=1 Tax=Daldinia vernicosa TaxID=114800 RepID=UPI0020073F31|nr:uncharacterized protein F5Y00DRAFT_61303 [Daldinia vernicosa]KAI0853839.1 hypothetical protein F5Y00DRAFT_61303 [Daldinia vernicosa]